MNKYEIILNEKLNELLKEVYWPHLERIDYDFNNCVLNSLLYHTEESLQCNLHEYEQIFNLASSAPPNDWNMVQMSIALTAVKTITPVYDHANVSISDIPQWIRRRRLYADMLVEWQVIAKPYIDEARLHVEKIAKDDIDKERVRKGLKPIKNKIITLS